MRSENLYYKDRESLELFAKNSAIYDSESVLIQVFTSKNDINYIQELLDSLNIYFPNAKVIGTTTDGEIMDGYVSEGESVINFTLFEHTSIDIIDVIHTDRGFKSGEKVAKTLIKDDTKAIITFATCYNTSGEDYLNGINNINSTIIVSGGIAAHYGDIIDTYVFTKDKIIPNGVVAVALDSKNLNVYNDYSYNWSKIGIDLTINEVIDNRVYKIDNKTAFEAYKHYLGEDIAATLPQSGIEFPLIINRDGLLIARAVTYVHGDGSLSFAGDFSVGDKVQFGYGDIKSIHRHSTEISHSVAQQPCEVIYIYSCLARRHYLREDIENETLPLANIATAAGFFTYGEFYTSKKREFLNQTMTLLVLSENSDISEIEKIDTISKEFTHQAISINAMAHLINVVSIEVDKQKKELMAQKNMYENLFEKSADGILILKSGYFIKCNEMAYKILGYNSKESLLSLHPADISPKYQFDGEKSRIKAERMMNLAMIKGIHQFEWIHLKADKTPIWIEVRLSPLKIDNVTYIYVTWRDIQKKKEMEQELLSQKKSLYIQANHDSLTGLANRNLFYDRLQHGISKAKRLKSKLALMFIDLDIFKDINDSLGHDVGDALLKEVAKRLQQYIRVDDTVARIGGDEFTVIMEEIPDIQVVSDKANVLLNSISKPYDIDGHFIYISCSIGISIFPDDTDDLNNLIKYADTAMYKAKAEGRDKQWFYSNEMTKIVSKRIEIDNDIREALTEDQFEVYYQSIVDANSDKIIGAEALIRWKHPQKGMIFPDEFIPVAEKSDLIIKIDDWVMNTSMKRFAQLRKDGLNPGVLSLNLAIKQLESPDYIQKLIATMKHHSFKPEWLKLEILERQVMKKAKENIIKLNKIKELGVTLAMDDFGTGESSFTYLRKFPVSQIKIDKSFVMGMQEENENREIVKAITALGDALSLEVIAEGVENEQDKRYLLDNSCHIMQGYYFSKPVSADDFTALLIKN
jgi:diguanylate cyclase (GGDEF)-like protein/PAS domain S-box-containing protein